MKIGIITFQNSHNYGAFLQQYALKKIIERKGHSIEVINYKSLRYLILEFITMLIRDPISKLKLLYSNHNALMNYGKLITNKKNLFRNQYDLLIYGSDEIWNLNRISLGKNDFYFGNTYEEQKTSQISYAASFGHTKKVDFKHKRILEHLKLFDALSVRDDNSKEILKTQLDLDSEIHLDPVLIYDFEDELSGFSNKELKLFNNNIVVYGKIVSKNFIKRIKLFAKNNKKKIISLGFYNGWADKNLITINPFLFLSIFKCSSHIFTDMFHGLQISLLFRKNFFLLNNPEKKEKIRFLENELSLKYLNDSYPISLENMNEGSSSLIIDKLDQLKENSLSYLFTHIK